MAMKEEHKRALNRTLEQLIDDLDVDEAIIYLKSKEVFSDRDEDCVTVKATQLEKVREFVARLKMNGDKAFTEFMQYLKGRKKSQHLGDLLQQNIGTSRATINEKGPFQEHQPPHGSATNQGEIFISYSSKSMTKVMELKHRIDERLQTNCWVYRERLRHGDTLDTKISQAIANASVVLCMVDQNFVDSEECEQEVYCATDANIPKISIYLQQLDKRPLKKSNGEISGLNLPFARKLYCNQYTEDEAKKEEEFEILIESIIEFLQKKE